MSVNNFFHRQENKNYYADAKRREEINLLAFFVV